MKEKMEDRRIKRTRNLLHEALTDLIIEKGYEAITIQDIIDRANIGRSTFYTHFDDKEALLKSNINQLREFLYQQAGMHKQMNASESRRFGFSYAFLQHVQSHRLVYKATVGKQSGALVLHYMKEMLAELAKEEYQNLGIEPSTSPIPQEVAIELMVNNLLTLIKWWMDNDKTISAKEVDQMFHDITLNGAIAVR